MKYLRGASNQFEKAISRDWLSSRSTQLAAVVAAVKKFILHPTADNIRDVYYRYESWKHERPAEFRERGQAIDAEFCKELTLEYRAMGIQIEPDFESDGEVGDRKKLPGEIPPPQAVAVNRWTNPRNVKRAAKVSASAAGAGLTVAQNVTGASTQALLLGGAAAVSATGVGLVVTAGALTIATSVLAITSAWKTSNHVSKLNDVYAHRNVPPFADEDYCQQLPGEGIGEKTRLSYVQHDMVANHVLPYVIHKKKAKFARKVVSAVPVIGMAETLRSMGKKGYKAIAGTLGTNRLNAAGWLANHLITCDCLLAQVIVAELYSVEEMEWLKGQSYGELTEYLAAKMKST